MDHSTQLDWDLDRLFLFLSHATMCIGQQNIRRVFNDMAYKLMEWQDVSRRDLRRVFAKLDFVMEELWANCHDELEGPQDEEAPVCRACHDAEHTM
jgi:hypothetical protein